MGGRETAWLRVSARMHRHISQTIRIGTCTHLFNSYFYKLINVSLHIHSIHTVHTLVL